MNTKYIALLGLLLQSSLALAIDGYKDIKFGISFNQLQNKHLCTLRTQPLTDKNLNDNTIALYACGNFIFDGTIHIAQFYFIDNKLLRISLQIGSSSQDFAAFIAPLTDKYGAKVPINPNELAAYEDGKLNQFNVFWDAGGVELFILRTLEGETVFLSYTDKTYQSILTAKTSKRLSKDL